VRIYALRDRVVGAMELQSVSCFPNDQVCQRFMQDSVQANSLPGRHPEDFEVWCIDSLEEVIGGIYKSAGDEPRMVALLSDFLARNTPISEG